jgi:hypothetical protein
MLQLKSSELLVDYRILFASESEQIDFVRHGLPGLSGQAMKNVQLLNHVENILQQDSASNALNKLLRTFSTLVETLKKYRSGGEQKVTVEHVHVHAGAQAVVGNVQAGGEG